MFLFFFLLSRRDSLLDSSTNKKYKTGGNIKPLLEYVIPHLPSQSNICQHGRFTLGLSKMALDIIVSAIEGI